MLLYHGSSDCDGRFGMLIMVDAENGAPDIYQLLHHNLPWKLF